MPTITFECTYFEGTTEMRIEIANDKVVLFVPCELDDQDDVQFTLSRKDWSQFYAVAKAVFGVPKASGSAEGFDRFWAAYPKKISKGPAESAWKSGGCSESIEDILAAVDRAVTSPTWTKDAGRFVPHPTTWLRQRRWEDESTPDATAGVI
jgi:hypothetical protein